MPHIAITMIPGRDEATKRTLAQKARESMEQFTDDILYVRPGV